MISSEENGVIIYKIESGDTLSGIIRQAKRSHQLPASQTIAQVAKQSGIQNPDLIYAGRTVIIHLVKQSPPIIARIAAADPGTIFLQSDNVTAIKNPAEKRLVRWLILRNKGSNRNELLQQALTTFADELTPFWRAKIALIMFADLNDREMAIMLIEFLLAQALSLGEKEKLRLLLSKLRAGGRLSDEDKTFILQLIGKCFINNQPISQPLTDFNNQVDQYDPLLLAEYYYYLGLFTKDDALLNQAAELLQQIVAAQEEKLDYNNQLFRSIAFRYHFFSTAVVLRSIYSPAGKLLAANAFSYRQLAEAKLAAAAGKPRQQPHFSAAKAAAELAAVKTEYTSYLVQAASKLAALKMARAKQIANPVQRLAAYQEAQLLLEKISQQASGFQLLDCAARLAENLIQQGQLGQPGAFTEAEQIMVSIEQWIARYQAKGPATMPAWLGEISSRVKKEKVRLLIGQGKYFQAQEAIAVGSFSQQERLFFGRELAECFLAKKDYQAATAAEEILKGIDDPEADYWLGKIFAVYDQGGERRLNEAETRLQVALESGQLTADQIVDARLNLADIYNWTYRYAQAATEYNYVLGHCQRGSQIELQAQLGQLEVTCRSSRNYRLVFEEKELIEKLLAIDYLGDRLINLLLAAWQSEPRHHDQLIYLANHFLGTNHSARATKEPLLELIISRCQPNCLSAKTRSQLILSMAQVLVWRKQFSSATKFLDEFRQQVVLSEDKRQIARYQLIRSEIALRRDKNPAPLIDLIKELIAEPAGQEDYTLLTDAVLDLIEAYGVQKDYRLVLFLTGRITGEQEVAALGGEAPAWLNDLLAKLQRPEYGYFHKYLQYHALPLLMEALLAQKYYQLAASILERWQVYIPRLDCQRGELYAAAWSGRDYNQAEQSFSEIIQKYQSRPPEALTEEEKSVYLQALLGLADLYRYARGKINPQQALCYYQLAEKLIKTFSVEAPEPTEALSRLYLGMGKGHQLLGKPSRAEQEFARVIDQPAVADNADERAEAERDWSASATPHLVVNNRYAADSQGNSEMQNNVTLQLPVPTGNEVVPEVTPYVQNQQDTHFGAQPGAVNTTYAGAKVAFLDKRLTLDAKFKLPESSRFVAPSQSATVPVLFSRPDATVRLDYNDQYVSAGVATDQNFQDPSASGYSGRLMLNTEFARNPYARFKVGPVGGKNAFRYNGETRQKGELGLGVEYDLDLAEVFPDLPSNFLTVSASTTIPLYQQEWYYTRADSRFVRQDRWFHQGTWKGRLALKINTGKYGRFIFSGGFVYQKPYWAYDLNVAYELPIYQIYKWLAGDDDD